MSIAEQQIATSVLVIGTGGAGLRAAIELAEPGVDVLARRQAPKSDAHTSLAAGGINAALATMDPEDTWQQHAADTLKESYLLAEPAHGRRSSPQGAARGIDDLERYGMPFAREADGRISQRFFGAHTYRRTAFAGDYTGLEIQRTLINRAAQLDVPILDTVYITRLLVRRRRRVRRVRLRPRRRHALRHPRRRGHPRRGRPHPDLAPHLVAPRREHGRLVPPRRRGRRPDPRPRARAVPPVRPHRARERRRHAGLRGRPRRGRHPAQRASASGSWRATTPSGWSCRPATGSRSPRTPRSRRAAAPRTAGSGSTSRTCPRETIMTPAAPRLPDPARAADARHHQATPIEIAPTAHYSMGGVWVRPGGPRHRRRRALRDRRGVERACTARTGSAATR